jgi:hypothetical protein
MKSVCYPARAKHGLIKEVVLFARVNDMTAQQVAARFLVNLSSVRRQAKRMGVSLKFQRNFKHKK